MERLSEIKRIQKTNMVLELVCVILVVVIGLPALFWVTKLHCSVDLPLLVLAIILGVGFYTFLMYKELKLRGRIKEIDENNEEQ